MNKVTSHRLFYALKPDTIAAAALANAVNSMTGQQPEALRWVPAENWHITLKFIGAVTSGEMDGLRHCLHRAARKSAPVDIRLNSIEPFPSSNRPVVLAATGASSPSAENLVAELESCCSEMGWPDDTRRWRCHMTLARIISGERRAFSFAPVDIAVAFTASEVSLLESTTVDGKVSYLPVATAALVGSDE